MSDRIKSADILSHDLLIELGDGREALLAHEDVVACAEQTGAFARARELEAPDDDDPDAD